jgi:hypothetical protein
VNRFRLGQDDLQPQDFLIEGDHPGQILDPQADFGDVEKLVTALPYTCYHSERIVRLQLA